jgi:hypothetical protein
MGEGDAGACELRSDDGEWDCGGETLEVEQDTEGSNSNGSEEE